MAEVYSPSRLEQGSSIQPGVDIIKETKKIVNKKSEQERFKMAKQLLFNSLDYKAPRLDLYTKNEGAFP